MLSTDYVKGLYLVVLLAARVAAAQPAETTLGKPRDPEAARLYRDGNGFYKIRDYAQAIERYATSLKIEESQAALYNMAQSHRQLGNFEAALWFYRRVLASATLVGSARDQVEARIAAMQAALDKRTPATVPRPATVVASASPPAPAGEPLDEREVIAPERWYEDRLGWTVAGAGAIATAGAIGLAITGERLQRDANREPDEEARAALRERATTRRTWAIVGGAVGGGLAIAGAIRLARVSHDQVEVAVAPGSILVAGRF